LLVRFDPAATVAGVFTTSAARPLRRMDRGTCRRARAGACREFRQTANAFTGMKGARRVDASAVLAAERLIAAGGSVLAPPA
jgi:N-acetylglutamate synthase/N-acetylornithine aminotransferase